MSVYFMAGNRDFLVGPELLTLSGMQALPDPTALEWPEATWLLSHGDVLCTDDHAYQTFRQQVRTPEWQLAFLALSLSERLTLARHMRNESTARQAASKEPWVDVNPIAVAQQLSAAQAQALVHGHTHRPDTHRMPNGQLRVVLSDWDASANPARVHWLEADVPPRVGESPIFQIKT
jgi:UDP-2,3-diacylglucosamine hydrolase